MIQLKRKFEVDIYQVIATYKKKVSNAPFLAILQAAEEIGGEITSQELQKNLLHPLSLTACNNILSRMSHDMGYFRQNTDDYGENIFTLTELGERSAKNKEYFQTCTGVLKIYVTNENSFFPKRIVKIEIPKNPNRYENIPENNFQNITQDLKYIQSNNERIELNNGVFIIDKLEAKCLISSEKIQMEIKATENAVNVSMLDATQEYQDDNEFIIKQSILGSSYNHKYDKGNDAIVFSFDKNELNLIRNINIKSPELFGYYFDAITIKNQNVKPKDLEDALKWQKQLLLRDLKNPFLSDKEFIDFSNRIAGRFIGYKTKLKNKLNREQLISEIENNTEFFYQRSHLETIDYLNY